MAWGVSSFFSASDMPPNRAFQAATPRAQCLRLALSTAESTLLSLPTKKQETTASERQGKVSTLTKQDISAHTS